jgi:integrase
VWEENDLVFCTPLGTPLDGSEMSRRFTRLQRVAGVGHHRLYDCRHTAASFLLAQGVSPRVVMEVLGHSSFALTMDTYTHVLPALMRDAADAMDRALANDRTASDGILDTKVGGQLGGQFGGQTRPTVPKRP